MKEITIGANDAGQRLDRFLAKAVPLLPASLAQKYIRLKRIKLDGKRAERDTRLQEGNVLQLYINDEFFDIILIISLKALSPSTVTLGVRASNINLREHSLVHNNGPA